MAVHYLKTWPKSFAAIESGEKNFEISQESDMHFEPGDRLCLQEFDPESESYSGRYILKIATYCFREAPFVPDGYVVIGLRDLTYAEEHESPVAFIGEFSDPDEVAEAAAALMCGQGTVVSYFVDNSIRVGQQKPPKSSEHSIVCISGCQIHCPTTKDTCRLHSWECDMAHDNA
jgi:hypothetical protein